MRSLEKKVYLGLLVCLLVSIIGTSFAYFVSTAAIDGEGGKTNMKTADLIGVKFDAGDSSINLQNIMPGTGKEKSFNITVSPTSSLQQVTYAIYLNISTNSFVKCTDENYVAEDPNKNACIKNAEELVYKLMDEDGTVIATGDLLEKNGKLLLSKETKNVTVETTFNYKLDVTYKDVNADQNHNANKSFGGVISVEFAEID